MSHRVIFRRNGCFIESQEFESYEAADAKATAWENVSLECEAEIRPLPSDALWQAAQPVWVEAA